MSVRSARTAWNGTLETGSGQVELTSSGRGTFDVSFPRRSAENAEGVTSPEELLAASHTSCFAMQLSHDIVAAGGTPIALEVTEDITLGEDPDGGFKILRAALRVRGEAEGLTNEQFVAAAESASKNCPISKALAGVEITLEASLD